jgi:hypothetical protein
MCGGRDGCGALQGWPDGGRAAMLKRQAEQSRRFAFEESPDIKGKGGR